MDQNPQAAPEQSQPAPPETSGLLSVSAEAPAPVVETQAPPPPETQAPPPPNLDPIQIAEGPAPEFDVKMVTSDVPPEDWVDPKPTEQPEAPMETERQRAEREWHEKQQDRIRAFIAKRQEASEPAVEQKPAPFVSPHVASQTQLEMEAGRRMNEHHNGLRAIQPRRAVPSEVPGAAKMVPVFRPSDYTQPPLKTPASAHLPTKTAQRL